MNYRINIQILNQNGDELLDKQLRINSLDAILDTDLAILYAEAQQNELFDISDTKEFDDTEEYRESQDL